MGGKGKILIVLFLLILFSFLFPSGVSPKPKKGLSLSTAWKGQVLKVVIGTSVVIVLGFGLVYFLSKIERHKLKNNSKRFIQVLETYPFGRKKRLHVTRVGEKVVLLCESDTDISYLLEIEEEEEKTELLSQPESEENSLKIKFPKILKGKTGEGI